jgi:hypothetical protein
MQDINRDEAIYTKEQVDAMIDMINDKNIGNDCKILYLIELAYAGNISIAKAYELMESSGLSEHGMVVDAKYMEEFSRRYEILLNKTSE